MYHIPRAYSHITGRLDLLIIFHHFTSTSCCPWRRRLFWTYEFGFLACSVSYIPHISETICCVSLFDLFHIASCPQGPPMLLQTAIFHSFLWLTSIVVNIPWNSIHVSFLTVIWEHMPPKLESKQRIIKQEPRNSESNSKMIKWSPQMIAGWWMPEQKQVQTAATGKT